MIASNINLFFINLSIGLGSIPTFAKFSTNETKYTEQKPA